MVKTFIKNNYLLIILTIMILAFASYFFIRDYIGSKTIYNDSSLSEIEYELIPKTYDVNEYTSIIVSDSDMAEIYLRDYLSILNKNEEDAYYLLNSEYRSKKFTGISDYKKYINDNNFSPNVKNYYIKELDDSIIYCVYDENGNFFAFRVTGVMQYSVYLDSNTIEIW